MGGDALFLGGRLDLLDPHLVSSLLFARLLQLVRLLWGFMGGVDASNSAVGSPPSDGPTFPKPPSTALHFIKSIIAAVRFKMDGRISSFFFTTNLIG